MEHLSEIENQIEDDYDTLTSFADFNKILPAINNDLVLMGQILLDVTVIFKTAKREHVSSCSGFLFDSKELESQEQIKTKAFTQFMTARHCFSDLEKKKIQERTISVFVVAKNNEGRVVYQNQFATADFVLMIDLKGQKYIEFKDDFIIFDLLQPYIVATGSPFIFQNFISLENISVEVNVKGSMVLFGGYLSSDDKFVKKGPFFIDQLNREGRPLTVTQLMEKGEIEEYFKTGKNQWSEGKLHAKKVDKFYIWKILKKRNEWWSDFC